MNIDTPDGRFLVATLNKSQLEAIQRLLVEAFQEGFNRGVKLTEGLIEVQLESALTEFTESLKNG